MNGEVVGINSQIYTRSGGSMGLSFAIPIDVATKVADQLRTSGSVTRGRIGVTIQELTRELAESFGLTQANGALISSVEKGGPADKAGLEVSDVILKFDGKTVNSSSDLPRIVASTTPGSKVVAEVWRKGALMQLSVLVAKIPEEAHQAVKTTGDTKGKLVQRLGLVLSELSREQLADLQITGGLLIEEVKGAASGLQRGAVLLAIGNVPVNSLGQLETLIKPLAKGRSVALLVRRGENTSYVAVKLDETK
jgi:serine protease Do